MVHQRGGVHDDVDVVGEAITEIVPEGVRTADGTLHRLDALVLATGFTATDFLARSFTWNAPGLSTLRGAGLALLERLGPLKSQVARRMMFGSR